MTTVTKFLTVAFYHFAEIQNYQAFQGPLLNFCNAQNIKGTILLAEEGINGTVSGQKDAVLALIQYIKYDKLFNDKFNTLSYKESWASANPFYRMKVRLKKEIVALGVKGISPTKKVGQYIKPEEWNQLLQDPEVVVIDTRNDYEFDIGTFKNAVNPKRKRFVNFQSLLRINWIQNNIKKLPCFVLVVSVAKKQPHSCWKKVFRRYITCKAVY